MTIDEIRRYAKEMGLSEKRIDALAAELHPDQNGKLRLEESMQAVTTINYVVDLRENTKAILEAGKAIKNKREIPMQTIKEIRQSTGLSQAKFCEALNIPKRTVQDWEQGLRKCPEYVMELIAYRVAHDPNIPKVEGVDKNADL